MLIYIRRISLVYIVQLQYNVRYKQHKNYEERKTNKIQQLNIYY